MADIVAEYGAYVCLMHMLGEPRTMQVMPQYDDVVAEVFAFLDERIAFAVDSGIAEERICVDPGIGFGKTPDQNLELVRRLDTSRSSAAPRRRAVAEEHARKGARRPEGHAGNDCGVGRGRRRRVRARRVDGAGARRPRDRRGSCGCSCRRTGKGDRMTIELQSLVLFGHHGYLEEERRLGQRFLVDLWADLDDDAATSDDIDETVDYRHLAALVREVFAGPERLLLEALATATADGVIERFPLVKRCACGCASRTSCSTRPWITQRSSSRAAGVVDRLVARDPYRRAGGQSRPSRGDAARAVDLLGAERGLRSSRSPHCARPLRSGTSTSRSS